MTHKELKSVKPGDRVVWQEGGSSFDGTEGTVEPEDGRHSICIAWDGYEGSTGYANECSLRAIRLLRKEG